MGFGVPKAAGIGADLIGQHYSAVSQTAEFQLKIHQNDAALRPQALQKVVDGKGIAADGVQLLRCGQL